ncbi:MAG: sugar nucleotide-binding protein, partial [Chlamydiae bacterium]|nr:sugar nucleotide-binding protein [Chlamydiota bacterium]
EVALLQQYPTSLVVRVSWLFSEEMPAWNFTQKMLELLQLKPQLQVVSDQIGKVTYAEELARDILQLLPCEGLFHYAQSGIVSRYEYVQALLQVLQEYNIKVACREITPVSSAMFPGGAPRPSYSALDTTKVEGVLKRRLMSYKEALADCIKAKLSRGELHAG